MFQLSKRSLEKMEGIKPELHDVVSTAIKLTTIDFGCICGLRNLREQKELVDKGASKTLKSKHLTGDAVDLMAYIGSRASWELNLYDNIADAMKKAAQKHDVSIRWGCAWHIPDIRAWEGTMQEAMDDYINLRNKQGRKKFLDGPHFELS
tara:strand:- start:6565 stop:7014 length:450 start_codon:yes stop_codon:yes gene_type:complete